MSCITNGAQSEGPIRWHLQHHGVQQWDCGAGSTASMVIGGNETVADSNYLRRHGDRLHNCCLPWNMNRLYASASAQNWHRYAPTALRVRGHDRYGVGAKWTGITTP
jgi:hypothetical protein